VLLALRNTHGSHAAEELQYHLYEVCSEYGITDRLQYFIADSASNNDRALRLLALQLPIDVAQQRLRCTGHVFNLVCQAILYGVDIDCIDQVLEHSEAPDTSQQYDIELVDETAVAFEASLRSSDEQSKLRYWRRKGPIGKLHNLIIHARKTPTRRQFFKDKQKEAYGTTAELFQLVVNGGIRWNSTCDMLKRAFKLKDAIELYQLQFAHDEIEPCADDVLIADDWLELSQLLDLLKPLKACSKCVQSSYRECHHGALYESLQSMEYLLNTLEDYKRRLKHEQNSHFKAMINLGWKKLNKYYTLSDQTAAYRAAILLHLYHKRDWFEDNWSEHHTEWIKAADEAIKAAYRTYKSRHSNEALATTTTAVAIDNLTDFERFNLKRRQDRVLDDLERYLREDTAPHGTDPLQWWRDNHHRFPVLRYMAFDLLAAPASSAADERRFSSAGHVLNKERWNT